MQTVKFVTGINEIEANIILNKLNAKRILTDANY